MAGATSLFALLLVARYQFVSSKTVYSLPSSFSLCRGRKMSSSDQEGSSDAEKGFVKQVIKALSGSRWTPRKLLADGRVADDGDESIQQSVRDGTELYSEKEEISRFQHGERMTERVEENPLGRIPQNLLSDPRSEDVSPSLLADPPRDRGNLLLGQRNGHGRNRMTE